MTNTSQTFGVPVMHRLLAILAVVAAVLYLFFPDGLPTAGGAVLKTSMCVFLAALALLRKNRLLALALLFSACGDALLALDGSTLFVPALVGFLMTHVLYSVIFVRVGRVAPIDLGWRWVGMAAPIVFSIGY